ncbi:MAG: hypothetical protein IRZ16_20270 [Myxococcaceae bacterium]|nr:hypothetical protein [Myxococcaceae bacterium]
MSVRIDSAEIISFRLKVPRLELDRLPLGALGEELGLSVQEEEGELTVSAQDGDSFLRFRPIGAEAVLTEIFISRDLNGDFLLRVLGPLMVRFAGDLVARVIWNVPERNVSGDHAEVKITRGMSDYPGLGHVPVTEAEARAEAGGSPPLRNELRAGGEDLGEVESPEEREVQELLAKARAEFDRYLRLRKK